MPRSIRSFSLDLEVQTRLYQVLREAETNGLAECVRPSAPSSSLPPMVHNLLREDVDRLYEVLRVPESKRDYTDLANLFNLIRNQPALVDEYIQAIRRGKQMRAAHNKVTRTAAANKARGVDLYSASRAVEALLTLGMDTLEGRSREHQISAGNNQGDAGRSATQQPKPRTRKTAKARAAA